MDKVPDNNAHEHGDGVAEHDAPQTVAPLFRGVAHEAGSRGNAGEENEAFFGARGEKPGDEGNSKPDDGALDEDFARMGNATKLLQEFLHRTPLFR